jgi:citrate lyase subunit beta/citryl-CoA lyase
VTAADLDPARSYLYVPGIEPDRLAKSPGRGADAVIADLEDAVAVDAKAAARETVATWLASLSASAVQIWVRINARSPVDDIAVLTGTAAGVVVPKADRALLERVDAVLADRERDLGLPRGSFAVLPLIESAVGLLDLPAVAAGPRVHRVGIGEADLIGELGLRPGTERAELAPIRLQTVVASAAAGIRAPVAPTSTDFRDLATFRTTSHALLALGFRGRTAVHPAQVPVINEVFTPTVEEVGAARALVELFEAAGSGVVVDERGRMVDEAVVRSAREVLSRADRSRGA